ncbi:MAG: FG-GAP-like repeat-containing protein, partial [Planctomycetota bacterium]|nr:FG-GAP-like repeat-containing protein [Planctomycetota bacterium]
MLSTRLFYSSAISLLLALIVIPGCTSGKDGSDPAAKSPDLRALHLEGHALISQHRFTDAEKVLNSLVSKAPNSFVPLFNLGVCQLNQAEKGVDKAIINFEKARKIQPSHPGVPYNLGIIHRFKGKEEAALAEFKAALEIAPRDPDCNYQVAIGLLRTGQSEQSLPFFEMAVELDPTIRGAWNNLQLMWRRSGRIEEANQALATFKALEKSGQGRSHSTKYTEQGKLSEAIRDWADPTLQITAVDFPSTKDFDVERIDLGPQGDPKSPMALVDSDLDCIPSLWIAGPKGLSIDLRSPSHSTTPMPALDGVRTFCVGDVDEDGLIDLVIAQQDRVKVLKGDGSNAPAFTEVICEFPGSFVSLLLADIDMESDLDLLLVGADGSLSLALNEGKMFRPIVESPALPAVQGVREVIAVRDLDEDRDLDLLLLTEDGLSWISGAPEWKFTLAPKDRPLFTGSLNTNGVIHMAQLADVDGDLREDLLIIERDQAGVFSYLKRQGNFQSLAGEPLFALPYNSEEMMPATGYVGTHPCDLNNDGWLDLVASMDVGGGYKSGLGFDTTNMKNPKFPESSSGKIVVSGDIDGDGDTDLVTFQKQGELNAEGNLDRTKPHFFMLDLHRSLFTQENPSAHFFRAHLGGRRDGDDRRTNLLGFGTRVELRSQGLTTVRYQNGSQGHQARGFQPLIIAIGQRDAIDSVTLNWPDGVLQAELNVPTDSCQEIEEVQRKASSCPVLFTFGNGRWNFITDFMGGGGLGFWIGPGEFAPSEPTEVVRIKPDLIEPIDGVVRLSVMEPMQEICYTDRLSLIAVDHPPAQECYPEEYFPVRGAPPSGEPLLIEKSKRTFPTHVYDLEGPVELSKVLESDRVYAGPRSLIPEWVGYCSPQEWIFEFTDLQIEDMNQRIALFLDGWVEYPYSRVNFAAWQGQQRLSAPTISWRKNDASPWNLLGNEFG